MLQKKGSFKWESCFDSLKNFFYVLNTETKWLEPRSGCKQYESKKTVNRCFIKGLEGENLKTKMLALIIDNQVEYLREVSENLTQTSNKK